MAVPSTLDHGSDMRDKRLLFGILALLACGLIAAGCGGDDDSDGSSEDAQQALEDLQSADPSNPEEAQQAIEDVLDNVDSQQDLVDLCKQAVESSGAPDETKQSALDQCENAPNPDDINPEDVAPPPDVSVPDPPPQP